MKGDLSMIRLQCVIFALLFFTAPCDAQAPPGGPPSPDQLPVLKNGRLRQISSYDRTGGNADYLTIKKGATAVLADIPGPGMIAHLWVTISSADKYFLRRILLRITWDGEPSPSVDVPVGDFFGTGFQYKQYLTPYVGMSSGGYYAYWPMPFNRSARVEVVNETGQDIPSFYYHIAYYTVPQPWDASVAYFHAQWRREPQTDSKRNYTILEAEGRGHFVGTMLSMQSYAKNLSFLEGDEMIFVDGEQQPSLYGTGTEDYFNSGWYFNRGEFAAPSHGLILKDDTLGRIAAYRFHVADAIPFEHSIRVTIEHGHANGEVADYSSTAIWYQKEPHKPFAALEPPGLRIPLRYVLPKGAVEAETLIPRGTGFHFVTEEMSAFGADWSGGKQLRIIPEGPGTHFVVNVPVPENRYRATLYYSMGPDYGNADLFCGGEKVGHIHGFNRETVPGGEITLTNLRAQEGRISLHAVISGKDSAASGDAIGLDVITLEPERVFIPEWYLLGPFPNPQDSVNKRLGLDQEYQPEKEINLEKLYRGVNGQEIRWELKQTPPNGRMDLYHFKPNELVVAYALTYVYAEAPRDVTLLLGTDDGAKVFLNGRELYRYLAIRVAEPDQDRVILPLSKGWNTLLLKLENNLGGYNFYARFPDTGDPVTVSARRKR
jgi:D-arabinan exo alpha-(1,3)/(1,5)-arabinofuranosidase (non-reducing end)